MKTKTCGRKRQSLSRRASLCTQAGGQKPPTFINGKFAPSSMPEDDFWNIVFRHKGQLIAQILRENPDFSHADAEEAFSRLTYKYRGEKYKLMGFPTYKKLLQRLRWCKEDYRRAWKFRSFVLTEPVKMELIIRKHRGDSVDSYGDGELIELISDLVLPHLKGRYLLIFKAVLKDPNGGFKPAAIYDTLTDEEREKFLPKSGDPVSNEEAFIRQAISNGVREMRPKLKKILAKSPSILEELAA